MQETDTRERRATRTAARPARARGPSLRRSASGRRSGAPAASAPPCGCARGGTSSAPRARPAQKCQSRRSQMDGAHGIGSASAAELFPGRGFKPSVVRAVDPRPEAAVLQGEAAAARLCLHLRRKHSCGAACEWRLRCRAGRGGHAPRTSRGAPSHQRSACVRSGESDGGDRSAESSAS